MVKINDSLREYKKATIITPIFVALEVLFDCLIPLIMANLLDEIYGESMSIIVYYGLILIGVALMALFTGVLSGKYCALSSSGLAKNLRHDMFYKLQTYSFNNIDKFATSSLVTRLTTDVVNVQNAHMMVIKIAVRTPLMFVFSFAMSFMISPQIALIMLAVTPVLAIGMALVITKAIPCFNKIFKKYDNLNNDIQENIRGMRVVKSYVREEYEMEKFAQSTKDVKDGFIKAEGLVANISPLMNFCIYLMQILIAVFGSILIVKSFGGYDEAGLPVFGSLSTGGLSSLVTYSMQMLSSLLMLSMVLVQITMSQASKKRILEVLNEESDIVNGENVVTDVACGDVVFNNVSFKYSQNAEKFALENVNLNIKSGEFIGIIGGTGSSKSTLIQLISRLYDVNEGEVLVGGVNVKDYDLTTLRDAVAVVLQKNVLFSGTINDNLRWGDVNATQQEIEQACKIACCDSFIRTFPEGYETRIDQGGSNVSGGQKQRLCIARALLKKPKVLILDDSTSAVDTKTDSDIREAFKKFMPDVTKIVIAQRTQSVCEADKIIVLDGGKVNAVGTHEQLLETNTIYQEVYNTQVKGGGK